MTRSRSNCTHNNFGDIYQSQSEINIHTFRKNYVAKNLKKASRVVCVSKKKSLIKNQLKICTYMDFIISRIQLRI